VPEVLVETLAFMYRYVFLLWDEFSAMRLAGRARGGYQHGWQGVITTGWIVAQVFLRAYDRALRISEAMKARGAEA
jgi:cobalt/nickel transport system permease protein